MNANLDPRIVTDFGTQIGSLYEIPEQPPKTPPNMRLIAIISGKNLQQAHDVTSPDTWSALQVLNQRPGVHFHVERLYHLHVDYVETCHTSGFPVEVVSSETGG
ncbi:MAG: hypothetical protein Q7R88_00435 [bacterium]|nr:hypothetical protein [bacterium]